MGAYGLAVAAAFAVALAVLMSVSAPTAEAVVQTKSGTTFTGLDGDASNGDTVYVQNAADGYVTFEISTVKGTKASFTHSDAVDDGQKIVCKAGSTCDADSAGGGVTVALKIANDSGAGGILVKQTVAASPATPTIDEITVAVAQVPTRLTAKPAMKSINSGQGAADAGSTNLDIRLTDENGKGIAGKRLTVVSTHATLSAADPLTRTISGEDTTLLAFDGDGVLAGNVSTSEDGDDDTSADDVDTAGYARVVVTGAESPGVSVITVRVGELTATANVVLHGAAATITAMAEQSAIEAGGKTFIVVTATDSGGNPVANHMVNVKAGASGIVGPSKAANEVTTKNTVNKDAAPVGMLGKGDIPACGTVVAVTADADATTPVVGVAASSGTNGDGMCVIQVDAGLADGTADDASRGTHTITIVGPKPAGAADVKVEIEVGGAPDSITSDAPERIDPSDEITVNLTVLDDMDIRVGRVAIEVLKTAGDGAIITEAAAMTSDGRAKFTYLAPSTPGVVEFLARTKDANGKVTAKEPIIVQIGEEEPAMPEEPEEPVMPDPTPTLTIQHNQGSFSGGSLAEFAAAAKAACPGGSQIAAQDAEGAWKLWSSTAPPFANIGFTTAFADGFDGLKFVWITSCEADAMESEGSMEENGG